MYLAVAFSNLASRINEEQSCIFWVVHYALGVSRPTGPPDPASAGDTYAYRPELAYRRKCHRGRVFGSSPRPWMGPSSLVL